MSDSSNKKPNQRAKNQEPKTKDQRPKTKNHMRVIEWNINRSSKKRFNAQMRAIADRAPDILILVEVGKAAANCGVLDELELVHREFSQDHVAEDARTKSGVMVASRWPVKVATTFADLPYPDRLMAFTVDSPDGEIEVVAMHAPPGSSTGYHKIDTMEAAFEHLAVESDQIRIFAGDFNTPRDETAEGETITFGDKRSQRWIDGEWNVLRGLEPFGMVDAFRSVHGYKVRAWSHQLVRKGKLRWRRRYDHMIVSESLTIRSVNYLHEFDELSDHTPLEALIFSSS